MKKNFDWLAPARWDHKNMNFVEAMLGRGGRDGTLGADAVRPVAGVSLKLVRAQ